MRVERFVNGRARSNAYLVAPGAGSDAFVVDAGTGAARRIVRCAEEWSVRPRAVLLTHGHPDHIWNARRLADAFGIPVYLHRADWGWVSRPLTGGAVPVPIDAIVSRVARLRPARLAELEGSSTIDVAGVAVTVLHTPGHTAGSCAFLAGETCFSGDTVFAGGPGHWNYPGGRRGDLEASVSRLLDLPGDVTLRPGHGPEASVAQVQEAIRRRSASVGRRLRRGPDPEGG